MTTAGYLLQICGALLLGIALGGGVARRVGPPGLFALWVTGLTALGLLAMGLLYVAAVPL